MDSDNNFGYGVFEIDRVLSKVSQMEMENNVRVCNLAFCNQWLHRRVIFPQLLAFACSLSGAVTKLLLSPRLPSVPDGQHSTVVQDVPFSQYT